jgi:hypothetical protein
MDRSWTYLRPALGAASLSVGMGLDPTFNFPPTPDAASRKFRNRLGELRIRLVDSLARDAKHGGRFGNAHQILFHRASIDQLLTTMERTHILFVVVNRRTPAVQEHPGVWPRPSRRSRHEQAYRHALFQRGR